MRVEHVDLEYLLRASFHQFQKETEVPGLLEQAQEFETQAAGIDLGQSDQVELVSQYYQMDQQLLLTQKRIKECVRQPQHIVKFLRTPGRLLDVVINGDAYGWGALLSTKSKLSTEAGGSAGRMAQQSKLREYVLEALLFCVDRHFDSLDEGKEREEDVENSNLLWQPSHANSRPVRRRVDKAKVISMRVFTVGLECIDRI